MCLTCLHSLFLLPHTHPLRDGSLWLRGLWLSEYPKQFSQHLRCIQLHTRLAKLIGWQLDWAMQSLTVELKIDEINLRGFSAFILQPIVVLFSLKHVLHTASILQATTVIISPKSTKNESFHDEVAFCFSLELPNGACFLVQRTLYMHE